MNVSLELRRYRCAHLNSIGKDAVLDTACINALYNGVILY